MAVIQKEKARLKESKMAEAAEVPTEDSDSDTNISMNLIEDISPTKSPIKRQKLEKYKEPDIPDNEKSEEEKAYLKFIHTDEDSDHPLIED